jgi:rhamnose utilization protein RhaD (predicted bifunctional aldolase and dehydrogenase)
MKYEDPDTIAALDRLHKLAHWLGDPARDLAILAEGNVSQAVGDKAETFWLKASGCSLGTMDKDQFVLMDTQRSLAILDHESLTDQQIKEMLYGARVDQTSPHLPSTEAALHAVCLAEGGAGAVGHTHPTPFLSLLCSQKAEEALAGRMFPDEIVVCGIAPCYVPYVDPGPPLARAAREAIRETSKPGARRRRSFCSGTTDSLLWGRNADEVERVTMMAVKVARALLGTYAMGGPPS